MSKGRKALPGTYEARDYVTSNEFVGWINTLPLSGDGKARVSKAVLFGLGVKSAKEYQADKAAKLAALKMQIKELEK